MLMDSLRKRINKLNQQHLIMGIAGFVALILTWNTFQAIRQNYALQRRVDELKVEIADLELNNAQLELDNQYYGTDAYLELAAREELGLVESGEKVYLEPNAVLEQLRKPVEIQRPLLDEVDQDTGWRANVSAWTEFLF